jgi:hypothetical protein
LGGRNKSKMLMSSFWGIIFIFKKREKQKRNERIPRTVVEESLSHRQQFQRRKTKNRSSIRVVSFHSASRAKISTVNYSTTYLDLDLDLAHIQQVSVRRRVARRCS